MDATPRPPERRGGDADADPTSPRALLIAELALIDRLTACVCRRRRLTPGETEEFAGHVRLKLVENDYAILRAFRHRSRLSTYLHVVIERLFLDYRTAQWGRWRPSVRARQLGPLGVLLDRLISRDGLSVDEACTVVESMHTGRVARSDLYAMSAELPFRPRRRDTVQSSEAPEPRQPPDETLARQEAARDAERLKAALRASIGQLAPADRTLLDMRYREGRSVIEIARALGEPVKPLYRKLERIVGKLRRPVQSAAELSTTSTDTFRLGDVSISW
jgi:RNA polymerase sigma factor (sigma-70 family)